MPLFSCEINLILTWLSACVITDSKEAERFLTTGTKLYLSVVTLSTEMMQTAWTIKIWFWENN